MATENKLLIPISSNRPEDPVHFGSSSLPFLRPGRVIPFSPSVAVRCSRADTLPTLLRARKRKSATTLSLRERVGRECTGYRDIYLLPRGRAARAESRARGKKSSGEKNEESSYTPVRISRFTVAKLLLPRFFLLGRGSVRRISRFRPRPVVAYAFLTAPR